MELKATVLLVADTYLMPNGERVIIGEVINEKISISSTYDAFVLSNADLSEPQHLVFQAMQMEKEGKPITSANVGETVHLRMPKYASENRDVKKGMVLSKRKLKLWESIVATIFKILALISHGI